MTKILGIPGLFHYFFARISGIFPQNPAPKRFHPALRPPGGVLRHTTTPQATGGRYATGLVSAHRRGGMFRAPIRERDWRPSCIVRRSSSSSVVSGERTAIRVTTAVSSLLKLRLLVENEILANSEHHCSIAARRRNHQILPYFQNLAGEVAACEEHGCRWRILSGPTVTLRVERVRML